MKKTMFLSAALMVMALFTLMTSCKKDDPDPEVIASFTFAIDAQDFKKVTFTNESQNFSALSWNFGDNSAVSTETNPVHTYAADGTYTVTLTATSTNGKETDVFTAQVIIADPNVMLTKLVGETSKTWKLLRDVSTGEYPLEVGPFDRSQIWWAMGYNNDELALRPCMLNDEWTFTRDGKMIFDDKGDYWAEGSVYPDGANNTCASSAEPMLNKDGVDVSAWSNGEHAFELITGDNPQLKLVGTGAYLGLSKVGTDLEYNVPQESITYNLVSLHDGTTDTLIVEVNYKFAPGDATPGGYWRFVLVHYDNPNDEPPIPANQPSANFTLAINGNTVTLTNTSSFADSYLWDFGDGNTSTEASPVYTYGTDGLYTITLTATNTIGTSSTSQSAFISSVPLSDELLQGGPWRIRVEEKSVFVGPGLGNSSWWSLPKAFLDGSSTGGDDWSCMPDDEFTFSAGGVFTYDTKGSARNDGYFGGENGCISDAEIAASGNGAFFGSGTHSYTFTPASGTDRPIIILTNGPDRAAFIGFYKGYYGGENTNNANPPNGGNPTNRYEVMGYAKGATMEYLFVSVDISADMSGGAAWSMILERPSR
jgi:PKD repeat protein